MKTPDFYFTFIVKKQVIANERIYKNSKGLFISVGNARDLPVVVL